MPAFPQPIVDYFRAARQRAQRRKSAWNLLLFPLGFGAWIGIWYAFFRLVWAFHTTIYPDHQLADFWQRGISFASFVPSFLMVFAPMLSAMAAGFAFANVLVWLIPPARRTLDAEARGYPGTSFNESMRSLGKIFLWTFPIGFVVALAAALCLTSLR